MAQDRSIGHALAEHLVWALTRAIAIWWEVAVSQQFSLQAEASSERPDRIGDSAL